MGDNRIERRGLLAGAAFTLLTPAAALAAGAKPRVAITTGKGVMVVELEAQRAPITTANFLHYVDTQKYDGASFYRAARTPGVPSEGTIVAQLKPGSHGFAPIAHESTAMTGLRHRTGTISLGRFSVGSATSDFFICLGDQPFLDANPRRKAPKDGDNLGYAAFGQVVSGLGVARKILASPTNGHSPFPDQKGQWLSKPVPIETARRA